MRERGVLTFPESVWAEAKRRTDVIGPLASQGKISRTEAEMATKYATDMESLLREGKPLNSETKAALMKQFEAAALKAGQESWNRVLGLGHKEQSKQRD